MPMFLSAGSRWSPSSSPSLDLVSWSSGTDEQIVAMVAAADRGDIDLTEHWNIGDERSVTLNQNYGTVTWVLVAYDTKTSSGATNPCYMYPYITPISGGRSYPSFIVEQKELFPTGKKVVMNSNNTNAGAWNNCGVRSNGSTIFYPNVIPSGIKPIIKQVGVQTANTSNNSALETSDGDYVFIPTEREVYGSVQYCPDSEINAFMQWQWYVTGSKYKYIIDTVTSNYYWLRSSHATDSRCYVLGGNTTSSMSGAANSQAYAFCCCI